MKRGPGPSPLKTRMREGIYGVVAALVAFAAARVHAQPAEDLPEHMRGSIPLRVESEDGIALHARATAWRGWTRLCDGPCEIALAPRSYELALSAGDGEPVFAGPLGLSGLTRIHLEYESRAGARETGETILQIASVPIWTGVAGFLVWSLVNGLASEASGGTSPGVLYELLGASLGTMAVGGIIALFAIPFTSQEDRAHMNVFRFD
jgi:hypothetical protein